MCDQRLRLDAVQGAQAGQTALTVLMIGRTEAASSAYLRRSNASVIACSFAALDGALLNNVAPVAVAFPLMADGFDATQVLGRLTQIGFLGEVIIFAPRLPNRDMVLCELRGLAPTLSLDIIEPLVDRPQAVAAATPVVNSRISNSASSTPTDTRKNPSEMPSAARASAPIAR